MDFIKAYLPRLVQRERLYSTDEPVSDRDYNYLSS